MSEVQLVGIVGGGFMGSGIAESVARAGIAVHVYEPQDAPLQRSRERIAASVDKAVSGGKLEAGDAEALKGRVTWTSDIGDLAQADVVVEAVVENLAVKRAVFQQLDATVKPGALLTSNTSSIPIAELAAATERPESVLGLHFFSPVPVMKLVEVVVALGTADEAVERAEAFATALGKTPIRAGDRAGFIVNALLIPYMTSAVRMYEEGFATREAIDEGMRLGCGHPMGPLTLCDFVGLDVVLAVADSLHDEFRRPEYAAPPMLRRMVSAGRLGRKTGRGFYEHS
jgi:3-hydroxybutyryl-CoA dehydrogenase